MKDKEKEKDDLHVYEIGYHILPTINEPELSAEVAKIHSLIDDGGGTIISESFPESRTLSYEIAKRIETKYVSFNKAHFGWIKFELDRNMINGIERQMKENPNILRFIVIKTFRENTLYIPKMILARKESEIITEPLVSEMSERETKTLASVEEIDKSIDELVIN